LTIHTAIVVDQVEKTFRDESYNTIRIVQEPNTNCCDVIATSQDLTNSMITKIVDNIDTLGKDILIELMLLGYFLRATPFLVGLYNRRSELEDNTIYFRLDGHIIALNLNTFTQLITHKIHPQKIAKRGGYMYQINGEELKKIRENQSLSRKFLSESLNISIKTIAEYERKKLVHSHIHHVEKLEEIFQQSLKIPIRILDIPKKPKKIEQNRPSSQTHNPEIAQEISEILADLGIFQYWTNNSPFDVFFRLPGIENQLQIISGVFSNIKSEDLNRLYNIAQIVKISTKMGPVRAIVEDDEDIKQCKRAGVLPIYSKELKRAKEAKEILKILSIR